MPRHQSPNVPPTLGPALRAARIGAGLSHAEAAKGAGVALATLENWEAGRTEPRCSQVLRLARLFEVPPSSLFGILDGAES